MFYQDVVVDLVSYRRGGHNEIDEPMFTQPLMYSKIRKMKSVMEKYSAKLIEEGTVTKEEVDDVRNKYEKICEEAYVKAQKETQIRYKDWLDSPWSGFFEGEIISNERFPLLTFINIFLDFIRQEPAKDGQHWRD